MFMYLYNRLLDRTFSISLYHSNFRLFSANWPVMLQIYSLYLNMYLRMVGLELSGAYRNVFFPNCFWWTRGPFLYLFSSAAPQRRAFSGVPSQMTAYPRISSVLQAGEIAGFEPGTVGLQYGVATNEPPLLHYRNVGIYFE